MTNLRRKSLILIGSILGVIPVLLAIIFISINVKAEYFSAIEAREITISANSAPIKEVKSFTFQTIKDIAEMGESEVYIIYHSTYIPHIDTIKNLLEKKGYEVEYDENSEKEKCGLIVRW